MQGVPEQAGRQRRRAPHGRSGAPCWVRRGQEGMWPPASQPCGHSSWASNSPSTTATLAGSMRDTISARSVKEALGQVRTCRPRQRADLARATTPVSPNSSPAPPRDPSLLRSPTPGWDGVTEAGQSSERPPPRAARGRGAGGQRWGPLRGAAGCGGRRPCPRRGGGEGRRGQPGRSRRRPASCPCPAGPAASCPARHFDTRCQTLSGHAGTPLPAHTVGTLCARSKGGRLGRRQPDTGPHWPGAHTHADLGELAEVQGAVAVDGRAQVLAVVAVPHHLQLPHAAHVGQARLDLRHVQHLPAQPLLRSRPLLPSHPQDRRALPGLSPPRAGPRARKALPTALPCPQKAPGRPTWSPGTVPPP